jgi:hypothetical protein
MKRLLLVSALLLAPALAPAETLDLGARGTFSITPPKGWTFSATREEDMGFVVLISPPGDVNAQFVLNLVFADKGEASSNDDIRDKALAAADQFVESSVEKKKVLREFSLPAGSYGAYCVFTDASLVGQPPKKDSFKMVAVGIARLSDGVSASVNLLFDDDKGPEFASMLAALSSAKVTKK